MAVEKERFWTERKETEHEIGRTGTERQKRRKAEHENAKEEEEEGRKRGR